MLHFNSDTAYERSALILLESTIDGEKGVTLTGGAAINKDINSASQKDLVQRRGNWLTDCYYCITTRFW